jgi:hypothetical protein
MYSTQMSIQIPIYIVMIACPALMIGAVMFARIANKKRQQTEGGERRQQKTLRLILNILMVVLLLAAAAIVAMAFIKLGQLN